MYRVEVSFLNKSDLGFSLCLLVFSVAAVVVGIKSAGAREMDGSEAPFKGSPRWMVEEGGSGAPGASSAPFFGIFLAFLERGRQIKEKKSGRIWLSGSQGLLLRRVSFFLLACLSLRAGFLFFFIVVMTEDWPAMPGRFSRPRRRNRTTVPIRWDGALFAVLKARCGEGSCRLCSSHRRCEQVEELRGGVAIGIEEDVLSGFCGIFMFCRGPFAKVRCVHRILQGPTCIFVSFGVLCVKVFQMLRVSSGVCCAVTCSV